ncbi:MAG: helix-turn-helix domain-containing protein [Desulfobacteraceae bacterium]|jgi:excisionase family DNA binding protein
MHDMHAKEEESLISIGEAAAFLSVPRSWLYSRTRTHAIPFIKLGRYVRFRKSDLLTWAQEQQGR